MDLQINGKNLFLFVFWLREMLHLIGMTSAQAVFATTSIRPAGYSRSAIS